MGNQRRYSLDMEEDVTDTIDTTTRHRDIDDDHACEKTKGDDKGWIDTDTPIFHMVTRLVIGRIIVL
jgi:hypothetical protein